MRNMNRLTRRQFLETAVALGATVAFATPQAKTSVTRWHEKRELYPEGVASGDPEPDSVILWTRHPFASGTQGVLIAEIAEDRAFQRVIATTRARVHSASD